jgi:glycine dehydrogenase
MEFVDRHIGPRDADVIAMAQELGFEDADALIASVVPEVIAWTSGLDLPAPMSEPEVTLRLRELAAANTVTAPMIGLGYYACHTPAVIRRTVLENPAWYTAYTPYQPEISQGRLEALLNFQTLVEDLTALPIAGSSLLDEPTAVAEAMALAVRSTGRDRLLVDADTHPQTLAVLTTRAEPIGVEIVVADLAGEWPAGEYAGVVVGYPGSSGRVRDIRGVLAQARDGGALAIVTTDLLALSLLTPPGEWGADIVVGSAQRLGVPMGFGGPHAGFIAVRAGLERSLPGRLVGVSVDADGAPAYRLALQTREQHIRREKATSNICTAQVLLAVMASMYAVYHGPEGLTAIATGIAQRARALGESLTAAGFTLAHSDYFDTVHVRVPGRARELWDACRTRGITLRFIDADTIGISIDETTTTEQVTTVAEVFGARIGSAEHTAIPIALARSSPFLTHPVFHRHRSETSMLRYIRRLSDRDVALDRSMIPLGSCTMKLNAATEMEPVTWAEFAHIHPFAPAEDSAGYREMIRELEAWLCEVTGYDAISLQPNAGSQGEFAGLLAIRGYHRSRGDHQRDVCLIPSSAHGTNAASAVMVGMSVVVVQCDEHGNVDVGDLQAKIDAHADRLAALMITYPSTHGVFEEGVADICARVHAAGGQVYVDGANLNALVGLAKPGAFGADVSHLNLHKTFCIPHGGGGPGVGPVGVRSHLAPFLPGHPLVPEAGPVGRGHVDGGVGPVSGAPWGSAGILPIPYAYIAMMGGEGLTRATTVAILNANYVAHRLRDHYPILYTGDRGLVAHECILDIRPITARSGISVDDIAKRLIDYGFHAPTMSFPVAGTLMVEPTESEDRAELDRFCDAMIAIRGEIARVESGEWPADDNPLVHAPHTAASVVGSWSHPYSASEAAFPGTVNPADKYWPPVRRIDGAYGDRNLVCSCPRPEELATS